jgi:hypothetical protein
MKDLKENIENSKDLLNSMFLEPNTEILLDNQISIMEALQDIQEKMVRIEGKMRGIK